MQKRRFASIAIPLAVCLCAAVCVMAWRLAASGSSGGILRGANRQIRYTLYIGLGDKETGEPVLPVDEARTLVNGICARHTSGYTAYETRGGWADEGGELREEASLTYVLIGAEQAGVKAVMDEVLEKLNQSVVLVEMEEVESLYYGG